MSRLLAFWRQPARRYRDFQIVFTLLTLNFAIPAVSYVVAPEVAEAQFARIGERLGADPYTFPEAQSRVWRYLGAANVMTLALMCLLLQLDLRRWYRLLVPLTFLKGYNASLFLGDWLFGLHHAAFLAVALFDFATCAAFVFFARRAHRDVVAHADGELVPPPGWGRR